MAYRLNLFSLLKRRIRDSKDALELRLMAVELRDFADAADKRAAELVLDPDQYVMKPASERIQ